jgi:hypothetical protein
MTKLTPSYTLKYNLLIGPFWQVYKEVGLIVYGEEKDTVHVYPNAQVVVAG